MHNTDFVTAKVNAEILPLLIVYNKDNTEVVLQISDLLSFFGEETVSPQQFEALLFKGGVINKWDGKARDIANTLPLITENTKIDEEEVKKMQPSTDTYQEKDDRPLVQQFNEVFRITEDPLGNIIKSMESKGDDKYAEFNPNDIVFFDDAFNQEI